MSGLRFPKHTINKPTNKILPVIQKSDFLTACVMLNQIRVDALLDTGCTQSVISNHLFEQLRVQSNCIKGQCITSFKAVTASNMCITSELLIKVHFKIKLFCGLSNFLFCIVEAV